MILDRTQAPAFQAIQTVQLPAVDTHILDNGIPLHLIAVQQQPVLRLELILEAGTWYEQSNGVAQTETADRPGAAFFALKMLAEGTATRTSAQISEAFDRYGAFLELSSGPDRASLVVYCLTKHLASILPLVRELLTEPTFPEKELADLRNITAQNLRVNLEKNSYLASVRFRETTFGQEHPYGRSQRLDGVETMTRDAVVSFYERVIRQRPFRILLAGQASTPEIELINQSLGQLSLREPVPVPTHEAPSATPKTGPVLIEKSASLQSSIRIGRQLFSRHHPDFIKTLVMNEVFGGYFGSRLMKNIREEKGFTYGISSNLASFRRAGYFLIGTDVKKEFTQQTLEEIRKEIDRMQTELVPDDELETVTNYMAGEFAGSLNTPFEIADRYKVILLDGLPDDFLSRYVMNLRAVSPDDIRDAARQYLQPDNLLEVVVGSK
ncbi:MAG: insulinase family protein [Bacteroidetes bacterium]|nr:insulinase family protein [Fibrella sp.]